jgi:hypothetical protein
MGNAAVVRYAPAVRKGTFSAMRQAMQLRAPDFTDFSTQ